MATAFSVEPNRYLFNCPICLDMKDPVTMPCGHRHCMGCIQGLWEKEDLRGGQICPQCKESMVACDFCSRGENKLSSCLVCVASYCETHLKPHYENPSVGRHKLLDATKNQILLVTYTWLADVNASVAKCLCF
uniref:RING-type domain-containing protein n=1 Tax=Salmo trutta TaxID=8032 RepID=A0A674BUY0_SALTR